MQLEFFFFLPTEGLHGFSVCVFVFVPKVKINRCETAQKTQAEPIASANDGAVSHAC